VSAAVRAAAVSVLVTITPADAKPMRTGMRSNFGMYLTFLLLSVVDGREIDWIPLEESVRGAVRAARGLDRRLRGRLSGGQSYGARAQNGVPGEVTAAELILKPVSIHLARRVLHERVKGPCTRGQLRGPIRAPHHTKPTAAPQRGAEPGVGDQRLPEVGARPDALQ
jgi:hypothetical protein